MRWEPPGAHTVLREDGAAPTEPAVQVAAAPLGQAGAAGSGWAGCVIHITAVLCGAFRLMGKADQLLTQQILV